MPNWRGELTDYEVQLESELETARNSLAAANEFRRQQAGAFQALQIENAELREENDMADRIRAKIAEIKASGEIVISAEQEAELDLFEEFKAEEKDIETEKIKAQRREQIRLTRGPEWLEKLRVEIHAEFEADGTLTELEANYVNKKKQDIEDEIINEEWERLDAEYNDPVKHAEMVAAARADLEASGEFDRMREHARRERENQWEKAARAEAQVRIDAEVAAGEPDFSERVGVEYLASDEGIAHRKNSLKASRERVSKMTIEALAAVVDQDSLDIALKERAEREEAAMDAEELNAEFLGKFKRPGINPNSIPKDTELKLFLGEITATNQVKKETLSHYPWEQMVNVTTRHLSCTRVITLTAQGDGGFFVEGDTMLDATDPEMRDNGIKTGTIIYLGRERTEFENGDEPTRTLDPIIKEGMQLFTDADLTDKKITDQYRTLAEIEMNGKRARPDDYDVTDYPTAA